MLSRTIVTTTLPFKNLKRARGFYSDKLGLRHTGGSPKDGWMSFGAGKGTEIFVFESDSRKSGDTAATFDVPDLEKEMKALRKKGVEFEDYDLPRVKTVDGVATMGRHKGAWIKDPAGNVIALHQSR
jgi:catechol 2,3-dioxygenase-like lactoylglutathione lyase family enzyme